MSYKNQNELGALLLVIAKSDGVFSGNRGRILSTSPFAVWHAADYRPYPKRTLAGHAAHPLTEPRS